MPKEIDIETLRDYYRQDLVIISKHAYKRMEQRNITQSDIENCIMSGVIIEQYPDDYPFPSCLIYGESQGTVIHVVMSDSGSIATIITAYKPDSEKFLPDLRTRRKDMS